MVNEIDKPIAGSRLSSALTKVDLPAPLGAATMNKHPGAVDLFAGLADCVELIRGSWAAENGVVGDIVMKKQF